MRRKIYPIVRIIIFFTAMFWLPQQQVYSQLSLPVANSTVTIDFSDFNGSGFASVPSKGQLDSDYWAIRGFSDGDVAFGALAESGDFARGRTPGGVSAGGIYALVDSGNIRLMIQPVSSDFTPGSLILRLQNNTGLELTELQIEYSLYINNNGNRSNSLDLSYSIDDSNYVALPAADYLSPTASDNAGFVEAQQVLLRLRGLKVAPNEFLYLRWKGDDGSGSGSRDEIALDDIRIGALADPPQRLTLTRFDLQSSGTSRRIRVGIQAQNSDGVPIAVTSASTLELQYDRERLALADGSTRATLSGGTYATSLSLTLVNRQPCTLSTIITLRVLTGASMSSTSSKISLDPASIDIVGPDLSCAATTVTYRMVGAANGSFCWNADGGEIIGAANRTTVTLQWKSLTLASLVLDAAYPGACNVRRTHHVLPAGPLEAVKLTLDIGSPLRSSTDTIHLRLKVEARNNCGTLRNVTRATTVALDLTGTGLVLGAGSSVACIAVGRSSTTLSLRLENPSPCQQSTSIVIVSRGAETLRATMAAILLGPKRTIAIDGPRSGCPASELTYSLRSQRFSRIRWSATNGTIIGSDTSSSVIVVWESGRSGTLSAALEWPNGCRGSTTLTFVAEKFAPRFDFASSTSRTLRLNVLNNDTGKGLYLSSVSTAAGGTAVVHGDTVIYTASPGHFGRDQLTYEVVNASGCRRKAVIKLSLVDTTQQSFNLAYLQLQKEGQGSIRGLRRVQALQCSPDGRHLYAAGPNSHSIAVFARGGTDGTLKFVQRVRNGHKGVSGIAYIRNLTISPDGKFLYAVGYKSNALVAFRRNCHNGRLQALQRLSRDRQSGLRIDGLARPYSLTISPDGRHLYVAGFAVNALSLLERNIYNGRLNHVNTYRESRDKPVRGLRRIADMTFSPDGLNLYAASGRDHSIVVFSRNPANGALDYLELLRDGRAGVDGLRGVAAVALSPDGHFLYAAGSKDNAVAIFRRDLGTGTLKFVGRFVQSSKSLRAVNDLKVSPDGLLLFATAGGSHSLLMLSRAHQTGLLQMEDHSRDGHSATDGLRRVRGLTLSPDGRYVYCAGTYDNAISVFMSNRQPVARSEHGIVVVPKQAAHISVLRNDSDPDAQALSITDVKAGKLGAVDSDSGNDLVYYAGAVSGLDTLHYRIDDGFGGSSTATVFISVGRPKVAIDSGASRIRPAPRCARMSASPNPFSVNTTIALTIGCDAEVMLRILDVHGARVADLLHKVLAPGEYSIPWNGRMTSGRPVAGGTYFCEMRIRIDGKPEETQLKKILFTP